MRAILAAVDGALPRIEGEIDVFAIHRALEIVWGLIADANRYFAGEEPWAHKKTDPARMETILYVTAEVTRQIAILVQAVMPESGAKLLDQLGVPEEARDFSSSRPRGPAHARHGIAGTESRVPAPCRGGQRGGGLVRIRIGASPMMVPGLTYYRTA